MTTMITDFLYVAAKVFFIVLFLVMVIVGAAAVVFEVMLVNRVFRDMRSREYEEEKAITEQEENDHEQSKL